MDPKDSSLFFEKCKSYLNKDGIFICGIPSLESQVYASVSNKESHINCMEFNEFINLRKAAIYADKIGLEVHAGHGLSYKTAKKVVKIKTIKELNIGHFLVSESMFVGLNHCIKNFINILRK
mgnify:CR=1 FL=1